MTKLGYRHVGRLEAFPNHLIAERSVECERRESCDLLVHQDKVRSGCSPTEWGAQTSEPGVTKGAGQCGDG